MSAIRKQVGCGVESIGPRRWDSRPTVRPVVSCGAVRRRHTKCSPGWYRNARRRRRLGPGARSGCPDAIARGVVETWLCRPSFEGTAPRGKSVDAQSRRATVDSTDRGPRQATPSTGEHPASAVQRRANDRVWAGGRHVGTYANRRLRPVEIEILVRYRDALSGRVLELGSGAGRLTGYLATIARSVHGIDLSERMIASSRARYPAASFAQGD